MYDKKNSCSEPALPALLSASQIIRRDSNDSHASRHTRGTFTMSTYTGSHRAKRQFVRFRDIRDTLAFNVLFCNQIALTGDCGIIDPHWEDDFFHMGRTCNCDAYMKAHDRASTEAGVIRNIFSDW